MTDQPEPALIERAISLLGWTPRDWRPVQGGYTPAARYLASAGRDRCFVKVATTPLTARMLRQEAAAYQSIRADFMPGFIGWSDHDIAPMLIIEDLSAARWPPPWDPPMLEAVLGQIDAMHSIEAALAGRSDDASRRSGGWKAVAKDPDPLLSLGFLKKDWLDRSLPALIEAEAACSTEGATLVHYDLRSDNICLAPFGPKFVDWAEAQRGNPRLDLGSLLPSLLFEGGPEPEAILPDAPDVAAWVSGYFAARAGLPNIPDAPRVRRVQRDQLSTALPWAQRALKLDDL